jgi:hypothetical protein
MDQLHKCFENNHAPNIKIYVSPFGDIERGGYLVSYKNPGIDPLYWTEIPFQKFVGEASPEAIVLINFINTHKRLPNFYHVSYEHRKLNEKFRSDTARGINLY